MLKDEEYEMKNRTALFPLILGILALLCFLLAALLISSAVQPPWGRTLLLLLPSIVLGGIAFLSRKGILGDRSTLVLTSVMTVVFLLLSVFYFFLLAIWTATTETTDTKYYARAYERIKEEESVRELFPAALPEDAEDVSFLYTPQFLQGGEVFQLSYRTTEDKIAEWIGRLEQAAVWIGTNEEWHRTHNSVFSGRDSTRYQLYWDGGFNHGKISYVLIDQSDCRIEFFYSVW